MGSPLTCRLCLDSRAVAAAARCREFGWGYKRVWKELARQGFEYARAEVQDHCSHSERNIQSSLDEAIAGAQAVVTDDYWASRGIAPPPPGYKLVAATVEERGLDGEKHWLRVRPESENGEEERVEIRQAQPVVIDPMPARKVVSLLGQWRTYLASPDAQIGWWKDSYGNWHTTHDERCFSIGHQVAAELADSEGLDGWVDLGDLFDLAAPSRHNPTTIDLYVEGLNRSFQRGTEEFARRRSLVGPDGDVVVMGGNHDIRLPKAVADKQPYLIGLRRGGDPEDEYPVLSVPYMTRSREYAVEWCTGFPTVYRKINTNLVAFHAPAYSSRALDTARKIAARVHASVIHGHTHRREALAENIATIEKGTRTLEVWSDGTWARTDGSLPGHESAYDDRMDRVITSALPRSQGMLTPNMHQGFSIIHFEPSGKERFSVERIAIWDGFAQWRGVTFEADCNSDGEVLPAVPAAA